MKATVIREFRGCVDGERHPRPFAIGDTIEGDLARAMVEAGYAKSLGGAPENKMIDGAAEAKNPGGPTGGGKRSSSRPAGQAKTAKTSKRRAAKPKSS